MRLKISQKKREPKKSQFLITIINKTRNNRVRAEWRRNGRGGGRSRRKNGWGTSPQQTPQAHQRARSRSYRRRQTETYRKERHYL